MKNDIIDSTVYLFTCRRIQPPWMTSGLTGRKDRLTIVDMGNFGVKESNDPIPRADSIPLLNPMH